MLHRTRSVVAALAVMLPAAATDADDWPQWRGPARDGISSEKGWSADWPAAGPKVLWKTSVGGGHSAVAVVADRLYTMGNTVEDNRRIDNVWCLDADTGVVLWKYSYESTHQPYDGTFATPTVDAGRVYTLGKTGRLCCFDANTGRVVWRKDLVKDLGGRKPYYSWACSPLVVGKLLVVEAGGADGKVTALDKLTGELVWRSGKTGDVPGYSSPIAYELNGATCVAILSPRALAAFDAVTGNQLWQYPWSGNSNHCVVTPIVSDDRIFISASEGTYCAVLRIASEAPDVVWKNRELLNYFKSCVLWKGFLYGTHAIDHQGRNAVLRCVDFATGEVKWEKSGLGMASLILADGRLLIMSEQGELIAADASPEGYREISRAKVLSGRCWTIPVLSGGRIFCRNRRGELVCLDGRTTDLKASPGSPPTHPGTR